MPEIFPLAITGKTRSFDHPSPEYAKLFKHQTIWLVNQNWPEVVKGSVFSRLSPEVVRGKESRALEYPPMFYSKL